MGLLVMILLVTMMFGALPRWGYSRGWGYAPSGGAGVLLFILLMLLLLRLFPAGF